MKSYLCKLYIVVFSISILFLSSTNLYAEQQSRLALLIGNSNYKFAGQLDNPINDVRAIKRVLEQLGFTVLKYEDCSQKTMKRAIDKFGEELKTKDIGLFFYAGHGVQVDGYNYLLPIDAKLDGENDAEYDCVRAGRILAKMESAGSKTNIVILDACRANPFERAWRRGEKGSGLAFMNAPSGSLIAYSTAPGKTALDGGGKNSPYTTALLQHINKPNITIIQMFQRVRSTVMRQSNKKQIPWESTSLRGDFYFSGGADGKFSKQTKKTQDSYIKNTKLPPDRADSYLTLAQNFVKTQQYDKAIRAYTEAIYLRPNNSGIYYMRGALYGTLRQYTKSIQDLTKCIALDLNYEEAYYVRAVAYLALNQKTKAIKDLTQAIDLDQKKPRPYYFRGIAFMNLKQYKKAIQDYTQAIDLNLPPKFLVDAYFRRGSAFMNLKQYKKAIQDYTQVIDLDPTGNEAYNDRGIIYVQLDRRIKACADAKKACELGDCKLLALLKEEKDIYNCE